MPPEWQSLLLQLMETNPFCITDAQLSALFAAMQTELGPIPPDHPAILRLRAHVRYEYTAAQLAQIMARCECHPS